MKSFVTAAALLFAFDATVQASSPCGTSVNQGAAGTSSDPSVVAVASEAGKRSKLLTCDANRLDVVAGKGFALKETARSDAFDAAMFDAVKAGRKRDAARAIHAYALAAEAGSSVQSRFAKRWKSDWCARQKNPAAVAPEAPDFRVQIRQLNMTVVEQVSSLATQPWRTGLTPCNTSLDQWISRLRKEPR